MLKSAIVIRWTDHRNKSDDRLAALLRLDIACRSLSQQYKREVSILFQHNLKQDTFATAVECGSLTFSGISKNYLRALHLARRSIERHLEKEYAKSRAEKKRKAGKTNSK